MQDVNVNVNVFDQIKTNLINIDPVAYCQNNLMLDNQPFRLEGNGYKPFSDIFRYIGIHSLKPNAKPVVLVKGRQVGATTMASALELYFMTSGLFGTGGRPPMRIIHAFPTLIHVFQYAKTKFNPMVKSAVMMDDPKKMGKKISVIESKLDRSSGANDSLQYKQFLGGNFIRIESTGRTGDRLRGTTVDCIFYDEIQDINAVAIANANKTLTVAQYGKTGGGVKIYFGTPKSRSSEYFKMWESSTQAYYHLGCEKCENYFPLYTPGSNEWENIWIHGFIVKCPFCDHTQDKRHAAERGKWIHLAFSDSKKKELGEDECKMIGFHINQLYNPRISREDIENEKPENSAINTERAWQNEVLGEFYAGEMGPITPEEIEQLCADDRRMRSNISISEGKNVFVGFDWGKKNDPDAVGKEASDRQGGQSYSTCVVLTEDGPGRLLIDYASIVKKNDVEYKLGFVREVMRKYSVTQAVGDIGYAHDLTELLQKDYGDRFLASQMAPQVNGFVKLNNQSFPHFILAQREYHIAEMFNVMKRGMIRFPWKDFEKISWLVDHCCSMEVKTTFNVVNEPVRRFVKGATPNDGFMALLNAYLAYKYYVTGGFSNLKKGITGNDGGGGQIPAIVGYCPF